MELAGEAAGRRSTDRLPEHGDGFERPGGVGEPKFCRYWDVEPRYVPITTNRFVVDPDEVIARVDENTIGVVPILGITLTGEFEPIEQIHDRVVANSAELGLDVPIHVDAASGGFVAPFLRPDLRWDFRLPQVK